MKKIGLWLFIGVICLLGSYLGMRWWKESMKPPFVTIVGVVKQSDGIGRTTLEIIELLSAHMKVNVHQTASASFKDVPRRVRKILRKEDNRLGKIILFEDCIWTPEKAHYEMLQRPKNDEEIRLAYTMFESTEIPPIWVEILNDYFDAAVVPDPFHVDVYKACGVHIPIFTLPLGLDLSHFFNHPKKARPGKPFVYGFMSSCIERKNHMMLVKAFHEVFGDREDVLLKLNCRYGQEDIIHTIQEFIREHSIKNISFSQSCLSKHDYIEYFDSLDCYVSISRGEGFSIQPREALALGIPVIATNNTAQMTICQSGYVREVPSFILEPAMRSWGTILKVPEQYGFEFACKLEDVKQALIDVHDNYPLFLQKARQAKSWAKGYDYSSLKPYYLTLVRPKSIEVSSYDAILEDKIVTTSEELATKYNNLIIKEYKE